MIVPPVKDGLKLMSIGFFLDDNEPVMWRGPMLHRALEQFLTDVHWGEIDMLVVDMPPGTGDISISLGQLLPRAEVVVVTTPQKLAQDVASRAASMARKTNMRVVGVIENMSGDVFGTGGGEELAGQLDVPLLGSVALDPLLREQGDLGEPIVASHPDSETAQAIVAIAESIARAHRGHHRQVTSARRLMADNLSVVTEVYELARKAKHAELRTRLQDDITWYPAREGAWKACTNAEEVVRTLLWRADANRLRPGEMIDLGDRVLVQLRGRRLERLGAKGIIPRLFQVIVVRGGKVASIRDYPRREDALAAAGLKT